MMMFNMYLTSHMLMGQKAQLVASNYIKFFKKVVSVIIVKIIRDNKGLKEV